MPCYTVRETEVEIGKLSLDYLEPALRDLGLGPIRTGDLITFSGGHYNQGGTLTLFGARTDQRAADIKRAYSASVVKIQFAKQGWTIRQSAQYRFEGLRR